MRDNGQKFLTYFADAEEQTLNDDSDFYENDANVHFWLAEIFSIFDQSSDMAPNPFFKANREENLYAFV